MRYISIKRFATIMAIAALLVCQFSYVMAADETPPVEMSSLVVKMIGGSFL